MLRKRAGFDAGREPVQKLAMIVTYALSIHVFFILTELFTAFYSGIPDHTSHFEYLFFGSAGKGRLVPWEWTSLILAVNPVEKVNMNGYIKDATNGEVLIGATVTVKGKGMGVATNNYGFYSINLPQGVYDLDFSYVGYKTVSKKITLNASTRMNIELSPDTRSLQEVTVTADRKDANVKRNEMSAQKIEIGTIRKIPALMGEVDLLKAIQLLPGVVSAGEGTSSFSVRGGGIDQNLIILDEATVYNASHLMGFFSVFNNDAIKNLTLYKGDIPATYDGRLSSLLEVNMKDGNSKKISGSGGIGTISSRLTLEGPINKDKTSFIVSARRTYADLFLKLSKDEKIRVVRMEGFKLFVEKVAEGQEI